MDKITLTLNISSYNTIVQALQDLPWRVAAPVFQEIDPQVRAALDLEGGPNGKKEPTDSAPPVAASRAKGRT